MMKSKLADCTSVGMEVVPAVVAAAEEGEEWEEREEDLATNFHRLLCRLLEDQSFPRRANLALKEKS